MSIDPLGEDGLCKGFKMEASECFKKTKETTVGGVSKGESDRG